MAGRTIAIGDIHGCAVALTTLLDAIAPHPDDTVVTLGDYIDRGPDSRGVLDGLIALCKKCQLIALLRSGKVAVVGHTEQRSGEVLDLGFLVCIDTNCARGGWLTALDVGTGEVWQADGAGRLRVK